MCLQTRENIHNYHVRLCRRGPNLSESSSDDEDDKPQTSEKANAKESDESKPTENGLASKDDDGHSGRASSASSTQEPAEDTKVINVTILQQKEMRFFHRLNRPKPTTPTSAQQLRRPHRVTITVYRQRKWTSQTRRRLLHRRRVTQRRRRR